jgi:hypothetical protein
MSTTFRFPMWFVLALVSGVAALHAAGTVDASTLDGKVLLGYQGWFTCPGDGSQRWTHWSRGVPAPDTLTIDLYPDVSELDADERCEIPGMTIAGKPAHLFSPRNPKTVSRWLTLDADGAELPSDWYLRLAGEITRMFHGDIQPDARLPRW